MVAIKEAVEMCPLDTPLVIHSVSRVLIDSLTKNLKKMEHEGYFAVANGDLIKATISQLRKRRAKTSCQRPYWK
jgi:hypothetical protein